MVAQDMQRNDTVPMKNKQGMAHKWIFVLLFAWTLVTIGNVRGQTETDDDGALGNIYIEGFEEKCDVPIQENELCYSTKDTTGSNCFDETIAVLSCANNCASVYESIVWCVAVGGDCIDLIFDWTQCSNSYCADTYLSLYGQCVEKQREMNQCSTCPFLATASGELLTFPPTCSVFEEDYCTWQDCCEPCQYYLNFYGECMEVNFNSCGGYFDDNPDLPTCPLQIADALPPRTSDDDDDAEVLPKNDGGNVTNDNSPTNASDLDYSRMTWLSCIVLLLSCLEVTW
jgi:hypothetical protein